MFENIKNNIQKLIKDISKMKRKNKILASILLCLVIVGVGLYTYKYISHIINPSAAKYLEKYYKADNLPSELRFESNITVVLNNSEDNFRYSAYIEQDSDTAYVKYTRNPNSTEQDMIIEDLANKHYFDDGQKKGFKGEMYVDTFSTGYHIYNKYNGENWEIKDTSKMSAVNNPDTEYMEIENSSSDNLIVNDFSKLEIIKQDKNKIINGYLTGNKALQLLGITYAGFSSLDEYTDLKEYCNSFGKEITFFVSLCFNKNNQLYKIHIHQTDDDESINEANASYGRMDLKQIDIVVEMFSYENKDIYVPISVDNEAEGYSEYTKYPQFSSLKELNEWIEQRAVEYEKIPGQEEQYKANNMDINAILTECNCLTSHSEDNVPLHLFASDGNIYIELNNKFVTQKDYNYYQQVSQKLK